MSRKKAKAELLIHKQKAVAALDSYLDTLINSDDENLQGKSDKLCYWINDWINFLKFEPHFSPKSLRRYKRGEIIKVHLGFNIGSEEGGLHYAVVVDKNNAKSSPVVTIVPLTSVKPNTDINALKSGSLFLGNELFTSLNSKISSTQKQLASEALLLKSIWDKIAHNPLAPEIPDILKRLQDCETGINFLKRMQSEVSKMKIGSIALVNQITTISKIRIYDPKTDHDVLSNIKLSNEKLDIIDLEIQNRYTHF